MDRPYRRELVGRLEQTANDALERGEDEAASILLTLCGALLAGSERELMEVSAVHSLKDIERIRALRGDVEEWPAIIGDGR
jgi:hypothetical protein